MIEEEALRIIQMGYKIFPVKAKDKIPLTLHGHHDASNYKLQIEGWWTQFPDANVGLVVGEEAGICVLDIDPRNGGENSFKRLIDKYGPLPKTVTVLTGGGGRHFYFKYNSNFFIPSDCKQGIDIKLNGYVVAPPSLHASGKKYQWMLGMGLGEVEIGQLPDFLISSDNPLPFNSYKTNSTSWIAEAFLNMGEGNRNATFTKVIGRLHYDCWTADDIHAVLEPKAKEINYQDDLRAQINGICQRYPNYNSHISLNSPPVEWVKPIKDDAYFGLAGDFVRMVEPHTESDPVAILFQKLTFIGNIIGNKPHFKVEATEHNLKLNILLVGKTSKGRKGTALNIVKNICASVDPNWVKENIVSGLSSGEGLIYIFDESTKPKLDKRILIVEEEFSSTLKVMTREGSILSAIIRKAWDSKNLRNMTKNNPLVATDTHISTIGHITITEIKKYLNETECANGFGNRFLYPLVKRSKELPEGGKIHTVDFGQIVKRLCGIIEFSKTVGEIKRSREATEFWVKIYSKLSEGRAGIVGDLTARSEAYVMRIASIYALLDCSAIINPEHLKAALAVWEYNEASIEFIFGDMSGNKVADDILRALIASPNGLSRTDIFNVLGKHKKAKEIDEALRVLTQTNKAVMKIVKTQGRDSEVWVAK